MRRLRLALAALAILSLAPTLTRTPPARAGGHTGTAATDFTQVTPADALVYAAIQATGTDQTANLSRIAGIFTGQRTLSGLLKQALASSSSSSSDRLAVSQLLQITGHFLNGEFGLTLLPLTYTPGPHERPAPHIHLLLEAGLQPGITVDQLRGALSLLNLGSGAQQTYRNLSISSIDLNSLLGSGGGSIPANGPISGTLYATAAGNDALLATDLPTLKQAIDTYFGASPSITSSSDFQATVGALPASRLLTLYTHVDTTQLNALLRAAQAAQINTGQALGATIRPLGPGTLSAAASIAAESDGILISASPAVATGSLVTPGLPTTLVGEPMFLPADTLAYAGIHDIGAIIRNALVAAEPALKANGNLPGGDVFKAFTQATGLDLDNDILSWMHGDASVAVLPVGAGSFGANNPLSQLSLVATLQESDKGFVEAKLARIEAALLQRGGPGAGVLQLVSVPSSTGDPLHMLAVTPNGIGYTFFNGYLLLGTALPADVAALQRGNAGANLVANPLYRAALGHIDARPYGAVLFVNLTRVRQIAEKLAAASGADLSSYDSMGRPILRHFTSLAMVNYSGPQGGGALFIGIGR